MALVYSANISNTLPQSSTLSATTIQLRAGRVRGDLQSDLLLALARVER